MKKPLIRFLFLGDPRYDRRLKNFIQLFIELQYDIELIYAIPGIGNEEPGIEKIEHVKTKHLPLGYSGGVKMFLQYDKLLSQELEKNEDCDILFACELYSLRAAGKSKKNGKTKRLFYDARELYTELPTVTGNLLKKWFWKRWEKQGLQQTDVVIVTAPDDAKAIKQVHNFLPESVLIRNFPRREELQSNNYLREYFSIPAEKKIFVYIGGLMKDRGLITMIEVMPQLKDHAVLVIIGDGVLKESLEKKSNELHLERVIFFHPPIPSQKVIGVLSSADIGISLIEQHSKSYALALPSKIFEYMLAGLPVISSPLKQVKDILDENNGILFALPEDSKDLLAACKKAIYISNNSALRKEIHGKAYSDFTFEAEAEKIKSIL